MRRRLGLQPAAQVPRQQVEQSASASSLAGDLGERALAVSNGDQPVVAPRRERRVRQIGPFTVAPPRRAGTSRGRAIARSALLHGSRSIPSRAMPCASIRALCRVGTTVIGCSLRVSASRRRMRRARRLAARGIENDAPRGSRCAPPGRPRSRPGSSGAASTMRPCAAVPAISATARNGSRASGDRRHRAGRRGHWRAGTARLSAAVLGDAVRIGERQQRPSSSPGSARPATAWRSARHLGPAFRHRARLARPRRAVAAQASRRCARSTSLPPSPRSVSTTAMSAARRPPRARRHRPPCGRAGAAAAVRPARGRAA